MNVKIKETGVYCPFGDDYEQIYTTLKKQLLHEDEQLFTERTSGHGYLQWDLPGSGWQPLDEADPLLEQEVRGEYRRRQLMILGRFGSNQAMAMKIMQVPDDSYVYYKVEESKKILIKLTAWGYSYPERINSGSITGLMEPEMYKEPVSVSFVYAGKPMPGKKFLLNRILERETDSNGVYDIGKLPVSYRFDVETDGKQWHFNVAKGNGDICIDLTEYVTIEVSVYKDGLPFDGAKTAVTYNGQYVEMTFSNGVATTCLPLSLNNAICTVNADNETQQRPLAGGTEKFEFRFETPVVPELPVSIDSEDTTGLEVSKEPVSVSFVYAGKPMPGKKFLLNRNLERETDSNGVYNMGELPAGYRFDVETDGKKWYFCVAKGNGDICIDLTEYVTIEVSVYKDGLPYDGAKTAVIYNGQHVGMIFSNGVATTCLPLSLNNAICTVSADNETQQRSLAGGIEKFEFHLEPPVVPENRSSKWGTLLTGLLALLIAALLYFTFFFCMGMLLG